LLPLLWLVPLFVSVSFGLVFLAMEEGKLALKLSGATLFVIAVYLQFFSSHALTGLLLQTVLATALALWKRLS